jgi:peptidoglycan/xylan/chitin deacetylase (PgdA/CDA1 family)
VEPFWTSVPQRYDRCAWDNLPDDSPEFTLKFIDYCLHHNLSATFFIVGEWARRHPDIVKYISQHSFFEIGSHSYWHEDLTIKENTEFTADVVAGREVLEEISGRQITRFRAPSFSIRGEQLLLLERAGYEIDSSVSLASRIYGGATNIPDDLKKLKIYPFVGSKFLSKNLTLLGGGYLRLIPTNILKLICSFDIGNMVYLHPHDLVDKMPRYKEFSRVEQFRRIIRFGNMFDKLDILRSTCVFEKI